MAKSTGKFLKCVGELLYNTEGVLYEVFVSDEGSYFIIDDDNDARFEIIDRDGTLDGCLAGRFEMVDNTPTENQQNEFVIGSKVWVVDKGSVTVDTIVEVDDCHYRYRTKKASYDTNGFLRIGDYQSARIFLINETNQKALQVVYPQLNFEIPKEQTLAEKRYDVIKKLYDSGKVVAIKYSDKEDDLCRVGVLTVLKPLEDEFPYVTFGGWRYACAIDLDGNEITDI